MAGETVTWNGDAMAVAQVSTHTVTGTWATDDTATLTCGGNSVTFTVAGTETIAAVVAGLVAAWNASTAATLAEVTASDDNPAVTLTADTAGLPFVTTASETTAGDGAVGVQVDTTASAGPNDASTAANWSTGVVPVATQHIVLENSSVAILYGLDLSGATFASFTRKASYTGFVGLPRNNSGGYVEYRDTYLKIDATLATIDASGSGRTKIDFGTVQTACTINGSGTAAESGIPPILLLGTHVSNTLVVNKGSVAVAWFAGEDSDFASVDVGYTTNQSSDSTVVLGAGMTTLTAVTINGGSTKILANAGTVTYTTGTAELGDTATVTTLNVLASTFYYKSSGTCTTANVYGGARLDLSRDTRDRTLTNVNVDLAGGAIFHDPAYTATLTNGIVPTAL